MIKKNLMKKISRKNTANEESAPPAKRPTEEPKASTSAVAREQNNAGVDQGEKALLEIVMAGLVDD